MTHLSGCCCSGGGGGRCWLVLWPSVAEVGPGKRGNRVTGARGAEVWTTGSHAAPFHRWVKARRGCAGSRVGRRVLVWGPNLQAGGFLLPSRRSLLTNLSIWGKLSVRNFRSNCAGQNPLFEKGKSRGRRGRTMPRAERRGRRGPHKGRINWGRGGARRSSPTQPAPRGAPLTGPRAPLFTNSKQKSISFL